MTITGCGNNPCAITGPANGQATQGRCRCEAPALRMALAEERRRSEALRRAIADLADELDDPSNFDPEDVTIRLRALAVQQ